jgi:putative FmdB family regulatory protein
VPTYQYACTACDERLEAVQSFTDAPLTECPVCGGTLRKVFSAVGVVFKGSGFYKNDSRGSSGSSDAKKTETKADGGSGSGSGDKAAATTSGSSSGSSKDSSSSSSTPAPSTPASKSA